MASDTIESKKRFDTSIGEDGTMSMYTARTGTMVANKRFEDTTHLIPSPGYNGLPPEKYDPLLMRLPIILGAPFMLFLLGLGLEIVAGLSQKHNGFRVPVKSTLGIFGEISSQFLASFIPTLLIIPNAVLWRELDWMVRMYQPFLVLAEGNAPAERSVLLNYVELGPILTIPRALKYRHRLAFFSAITASITYLFQPFTSSVFQIRTIPNSGPWQATSLETVALAQDLDTLQAFVAGAGYADAAVIHNLTDPKFIRGGWAMARFDFPLNTIEGKMDVTTISVRSNTNCSNPVSQTLTPAGSSFTLSATSIDGCNHTFSFNPDIATLQYGTEATACPTFRGGTVEPQVELRPVMFWYFHRRESDNAPQARTVFCSPYLTAHNVKILSELKTGNILELDPLSTLSSENDVINGTQRGRAYNGVVFSNSTNPFIQARADAVRSILPAAIFRNMTVQPGGLEAVFAKPNGPLDATARIYTQHLSIVAKGIYFQPARSPLPGTLTQYENRLVVDPFPAHFLASILILTGLAGMFVHVLHRNQRKKLRLSAEPGSIAATTALTARSGFGTLLTPYDGELTMEKRLEGLKFGLDKRTGAIVAESDDEGSMGGMGDTFKTTHSSGHMGGAPGGVVSRGDETRMSLLSQSTGTPMSSTFAAYQSAVGHVEPWSPGPTPIKEVKE